MNPNTQASEDLKSERMPRYTSKDFHAWFKQSERDEYVFALGDYPGIQIVRKYTDQRLADKRMFIKFLVMEEGGVSFVWGGVDMVQDRPNEDMGGWTIVFNEKGLFRKPTSYSFHRPEDIRLDTGSKLIVFQSTKYSLNEFIDLLEQNHLRDMFFWSRIGGYIKLARLHMLFIFADSTFES